MRIEHTKSFKNHVHIRYGIWILCGLLSIFMLMTLSRQAAAADPNTSSDQRLVTVYDQGEEKTFVTNKTTIAAALRAEDIVLGEADAVEPRATTKLVAKNYTVNIYRARSVVVDDGTNRTQVLTAEQSPKSIVAQAGSTLYDEDVTHFELASSPLTDGGAGLRLKIDRAPAFSFTLYGKTFEARTRATTVGAMLKEKGIVLGTQDGKSVDDTTPITAGMSVAVWRNGKQTITQEEVIAKTTEEVKDADHEIGFREVRTAGADGKKNVTYEIEMRNGQEISRKEIASVTTQEPTKEVVAIGTKPKTYTGSHADWMAAAGISPSDFSYVETLIMKESGWNPSAMNASSGACGLVQALPCSKLGPNWNDPVVALTWGNAYVGRYGGWAGAWTFWQAHGWY